MTYIATPTNWDLIPKIRSGINILVIQAVAVLTVFIIWKAVDNNMSDTLNLHIYLTTVGYALLMTESIILFSGENFFSKTISRYHKGLVHGVFIGLGSILSIVGISIEINSRGDEWPHFQSIHAITGLVSMILMIIACVGGVIAANIQVIKQYITIIRPIWWKISHNLIGQAAYVIGMVSLCYGFDTWWFKLVTTYEQRVTCIVVTALVTAWTVLAPMITELSYIKSAFS